MIEKKVQEILQLRIMEQPAYRRFSDLNQASGGEKKNLSLLQLT